MSARVARDPETSLYAHVKAFLEGQGFEVKGEVHGCDIVAVRDDEPPRVVIAELKLTLSLELILQGVDRLRAADEVWLAVRLTRRGRDRDRRAIRLCRLVGFGLLTVNTSTGRVEVLAEPEPYKPRPDQPRRRRLLREHAARLGDPSVGGSTRQPVMTAYRQRALACAASLHTGPKRPRDLRPLAFDAGNILLDNVYGWFERVERGIYRLTNAGDAALIRWPTLPGEQPSMTVFDWHSGDIARDTPVTPSYRNTQKVRRFFKAQCGAAFKFDRAFMAWMKSGTPKSMGEAADEWKRRASARPADASHPMHR